MSGAAAAHIVVGVGAVLPAIPSVGVRLLRDFVAMPRFRAAVTASHSDPRR
jgi:hypothetical protein